MNERLSVRERWWCIILGTAGSIILLSLVVGLIRGPFDLVTLDDLIPRDHLHHMVATPTSTSSCNYLVGSWGELQEDADDGCSYRIIVVRPLHVLPTLVFGPTCMQGTPPPPTSIMQLTFDQPILSFWPHAAGLRGPRGFWLRVKPLPIASDGHNYLIYGDVLDIFREDVCPHVRLTQDGKPTAEMHLTSLVLQRPLTQDGRVFQVITSTK